MFNTQHASTRHLHTEATRQKSITASNSVQATQAVQARKSVPGKTELVSTSPRPQHASQPFATLSNSRAFKRYKAAVSGNTGYGCYCLTNISSSNEGELQAWHIRVAKAEYNGRCSEPHRGSPFNTSKHPSHFPLHQGTRSKIHRRDPSCASGSLTRTDPVLFVSTEVAEHIHLGSVRTELSMPISRDAVNQDANELPPAPGKAAELPAVKAVPSPCHKRERRIKPTVFCGHRRLVP